MSTIESKTRAKIIRECQKSNIFVNIGFQSEDGTMMFYIEHEGKDTKKLIKICEKIISGRYKLMEFTEV